MHILVCMHVCTLTHKNADAHKRQCLDPLEMELQVVLSCLLWEPGLNSVRISSRTVLTLNH